MSWKENSYHTAMSCRISASKMMSSQSFSGSPSPNLNPSPNNANKYTKHRTNNNNKSHSSHLNATSTPKQHQAAVPPSTHTNNYASSTPLKINQNTQNQVQQHHHQQHQRYSPSSKMRANPRHYVTGTAGTVATKSPKTPSPSFYKRSPSHSEDDSVNSAAAGVPNPFGGARYRDPPPADNLPLPPMQWVSSGGDSLAVKSEIERTLKALLSCSHMHHVSLQGASRQPAAVKA